MKWKCCGHELTTNFCPTCGASSQDPLASLLKFLKSKAQTATTWLASLEENGHKEKAVLQKKRVELYQSWVNAVEQAAKATP